MAEKYTDIIDAIYGTKSEVRIDTQIAFQDGTRQRIRATMPIATVSQVADVARSA